MTDCLCVQAQAARKLQEMKDRMENRRNDTLQNAPTNVDKSMDSISSSPFDGADTIPVADLSTGGVPVQRRRGSVTGLDDNALMAEFARDAVRKEHDAEEAEQKAIEDEGSKREDESEEDEMDEAPVGMAHSAGEESEEEEEDEIPGAASSKDEAPKEQTSPASRGRGRGRARGRGRGRSRGGDADLDLALESPKDSPKGPKKKKNAPRSAYPTLVTLDHPSPHLNLPKACTL